MGHCRRVLRGHSTRMMPAKKSPDSPVIPQKRKETSEKDVSSIAFLLTHPKSALLNLELSTLINERTWMALSQDSRVLLSTRLPPTGFPVFRPTLSLTHPANRQHPSEETEASHIDVNDVLAPEPDPSIFTDPFFEAALKTFQEHLLSGWLTPAHDALVCDYTKKLNSGEIHAPWKDVIWAGEHPVVERRSDADDLAGDASSITLRDLVKHSIIRSGDVLAYRRQFPPLNHTVAKDALIHSIQPGTFSITVLVAPSTRTHLPPAYLQHPAVLDSTPKIDPDSILQSMSIVNPSQLENALLDVDGSIERSKRRRANAWKSIGVWRWRDGIIPSTTAFAEDSEEIARGCREYHGTLFYLRGCVYDDL